MGDNSLQIGHLVRYGITSDQDFLLDDFKESYDTLIINASMYSHAQSSISKLISEKIPYKHFIIDPQTHAFQGDPKLTSTTQADGSLLPKKSIARLADAYGEPIRSIFLKERRPIELADLRTTRLLEGMVDRILTFQKEAVFGNSVDTHEYYEFDASEQNLDVEALVPVVLFAPYFFCANEDLSKWLALNAKLTMLAVQAVPDRHVVAQLIVSKRFLADEGTLTESLSNYISSLQGVNPARFFLWVDDFSEHNATVQQLLNYGSLIRTLSEVAPVVVSYGGYWSVGAMKSKVLSGLDGVGHSLGYGEHRAVFPVGGGLPVPKFYLNCAHSRMRFASALRGVDELLGFESREQYLKRICHCDECRSVIKKNPRNDFFAYGDVQASTFMRTDARGTEREVTVEYPTPETQKHCVAHYMWAKNVEYSQSVDRKELVTSLQETHRTLINSVGPDEVSHCNAWATSLSKL